MTSARCWRSEFDRPEMLARRDKLDIPTQAVHTDVMHRFASYLWIAVYRAGDGFSWLVRVLSGEFLLRRWANSGATVLARSILITTTVYALALGLSEATHPESTWVFSWPQLVAAIHQTIPWLGAIFAGSYVALYSRFASQWAYLVGLYNQLMEASLEGRKDGDPQSRKRSDNVDLWWAAFIEDALDLHLATKPMFAAVIRTLFQDPERRAAAVGSVLGGEPRIAELEQRVQEVAQAADARLQRQATRRLLRRQALKSVRATNEGLGEL